MKRAIAIVVMICMSLSIASNLNSNQILDQKNYVKSKFDAMDEIRAQQGNTQSRDENLFFSEYAEGSSNNKYMEIYNPTSSAIDLSGYAFPSVSNAPSTPGEHEYWNTFDEGASIAPGDVFVI